MADDRGFQVRVVTTGYLTGCGVGFCLNNDVSLLCCVAVKYFSAELEQRCQLLSTELSELRQSFAAERQHRSRAEDMLRQSQEQLQIQQQLTSQVSV